MGQATSAGESESWTKGIQLDLEPVDSVQKNTYKEYLSKCTQPRSGAMTTRTRGLGVEIAVR